MSDFDYDIGEAFSNKKKKSKKKKKKKKSKSKPVSNESTLEISNNKQDSLDDDRSTGWLKYVQLIHFSRNILLKFEIYSKHISQ